MDFQEPELGFRYDSTTSKNALVYTLTFRSDLPAAATRDFGWLEGLTDGVSSAAADGTRSDDAIEAIKQDFGGNEKVLCLYL